MIRNSLIQSVCQRDAIQQYGQAKTKIQTNTPISVLVWNVNKMNTSTLMQALQRIDIIPDLTFFQELTMHRQLHHPLSYWKQHQWVMGKNLYLPQQKLYSGVKTGSVFEIGQACLWQSQAKEPLVQVPKVGVYTYHPIRQDERELLTFNMHFLNFVRKKVFLQELLTLSDLIQKHRGPVILAGDFNTWSTYRHKALLQFANACMLNEVSFPSKNVHKIIHKQLSFIFTRSILILDARVLSSIAGSDHHPMLLQIEITL